MAKKPPIWRRSVWRTEVRARVFELTNRLDDAIASRDKLSKSQEAAKAAVETSLQEAKDTLERERTHRQGLISWWTGAAVATAWEAVHEAEFKLVRLEKRDAVKANLPWLISWIQSAMEKGKRRDRYVSALETQEEKDTGSIGPRSSRLTGT